MDNMETMCFVFAVLFW